MYPEYGSLKMAIKHILVVGCVLNNHAFGNAVAANLC